MSVRAVDPARSRIVLVGTPAYDDPALPDVPLVANNVSGVAEVLTDPDLGGFSAAHCMVAPARADVAQIGDLLHEAADEAEDLLLFYYSGHGLLGPLRQELYLSLAGTKPNRLAFTALDFDAIRDACSTSRARSRVVILDCCFSGRAIGETLAAIDETILGQIHVSGTYTLTSAPANRTALILPGEQYTAFTGRMLELLRAGSQAAGPLLSLGDIYRHLRARLSAEGLPVPQQRGTQTADLLGLVRNRQPVVPEEDVQEGDGLVAVDHRHTISSLKMAASAGPDDLRSAINDLRSAEHAMGYEHVLHDWLEDIDAAEALGLANKLESAGHGELATNLYVRNLDAVATLPEEEIAVIVRSVYAHGRPDDADTLMAAVMHRRTGATYVTLVMALWSVELHVAARRVLHSAALQLGREDVASMGALLRSNNLAQAELELYRGAIIHRPVCLVDFLESLRASERPTDAAQLLSEAASQSASYLAGVIAELDRHGQLADLEWITASTFKRHAKDLAELGAGLTRHGRPDLARPYWDAVLQAGAAPDISIIFSAGVDAVYLAQLDRRTALRVARMMQDYGPDSGISSRVLEHLAFEDVDDLFAACRDIRWWEGPKVICAPHCEMGLDQVLAEYAKRGRSKQSQQARFLLEQHAVFRPATDIPLMINMFSRSDGKSAVAVVNRAVGKYRSAEDIATIISILDIGRRSRRWIPEIVAAASGSLLANNASLAKALRKKQLHRLANKLILESPEYRRARKQSPRGSSWR